LSDSGPMLQSRTERTLARISSYPAWLLFRRLSWAAIFHAENRRDIARSMQHADQLDSCVGGTVEEQKAAETPDRKNTQPCQFGPTRFEGAAHFGKPQERSACGFGGSEKTDC